MFFATLVSASSPGPGAPAASDDDCCGKFDFEQEPTPVIQARQTTPTQPPRPPLLHAAGTRSIPSPESSAPYTPEAATFTNATAFNINDCPSPCPASGSAASLFPSPITVSGLTGVVERVSVTLNGFSHSFPADVDLLLVSPSGRKVILMSDFAGGSPGASNRTFTIDDYADRPIPSIVVGNTGWPFVDGTYRPSNASTNDLFPAPAPGGPYAYSLSHFNGDEPNGTWNLYVIDDANLDGGSISGGWSLTFDERPPAPAAGAVVISEFRTRGVGTTPPASEGAADEFIELYNTTNESITLIDAIPGADPTLPAGAGWRLVVAQGSAEHSNTLIPQTTSTAGPLAIPPHGYFLITTQPVTPSPAGNTYSLSTYPTGTGVTASGSANLSINPTSAEVGLFPDNAGLAIYSDTTASSANRLDSVGFSSVTRAGFKEGSGLAPAGGITTPSQHSWIRKRSNRGVQDTGNNVNDFQLVSVTGAAINGVDSTLGAPGPQRSPTMTADTTSASPSHDALANNMYVTKIDPGAADGASPNAIFDLAPVANGALGTIKLRAKITNLSGTDLLALRYRIVELSTLRGGSVPSGKADLRVLSNTNQNVTRSDNSIVTVQALTLQTPAAQLDGGGLNSSLGQGVITTTSPLVHGATTYVEFLLGVQAYGSYDFGVIIEGLNTSLTGVSGIHRARGMVTANPAEFTATLPASDPDFAITSAKRAITIDVLANDTVFSGELLTIETQPAHGTATVVSGKVKYTPTVTLPVAGDSFTYRYNGIVTTVTIGNYANVAGSYDGLLTDMFAPPGLLAHERTGRIQLNLTNTGAYTGALHLGGKQRISLKGNLGLQGNKTLTIKRTPEVPITLTLTADTTLGNVTASASSTDFTGTAFANVAFLSRRTANPALVKSYTLAIPNALMLNVPSGSGYALVKISALGDVTLTGKLADGVAFTTKTVLTPSNTFPLYLGLYGNASPRGNLHGTIAFPVIPLPSSEANGSLNWFKPTRPSEAYYPNGFETSHPATLHAYQPPPANTRMLAFNPVADNGVVTFGSGGLSVLINPFFTLATTNLVTMHATNPAKVTLKFNKTNGSFTGTFIHPATNKKVTYQGAVIQQSAAGTGFFRGPGPFGGGSVQIFKVL